VQRETWSASDDADFTMEIPGRPGQVRGRITLRDTADGCEELFAGEVKVQVPLVAGKLEKLLADILGRALRREGGVGADWLAARG
jgi:hypothetical protein